MTSQQLTAAISERSLLKHPFYLAWSAGKLTLAQLQTYARQYDAMVSIFPRLVSAVHSRCPDIEARKVLLANLVDEELHGADHPELWRRFAEGVGASRESVLEERVLPETAELVETFQELTAGEWTEGLCALFAYEVQVPAVAASKADGLKKFYGISDERTLEFFRAHQQYDVEHSRAVAALIDRCAAPQTAQRACAAATEAQWRFLDGMCRVAGMSLAA